MHIPAYDVSPAVREPWIWSEVRSGFQTHCSSGAFDRLILKCLKSDLA